MKKFLSTLMVSAMFAGFVMATDVGEGPTWKGTTVGSNAKIADAIVGGIAIADGTTNGLAYVNANGAVQIGCGSNNVANTIKFRDRWIYTAGTNGGAGEIDAAVLQAGTVASAISGTSITNLTAANIRAGGTFTAINGSALTSLTAANISAGTMANTMVISNATSKIYANEYVLVPGGSVKIGPQTGWTGVVTNYCTGFTNRIWYGEGIVTNVTVTGVVTP